MLKIFLALWLACAGSAHNTNKSDNNNGHMVVQAYSDPTGDNQNPPPPPPPPPHP